MSKIAGNSMADIDVNPLGLFEGQTCFFGDMQDVFRPEKTYLNGRIDSYA